jgi:hypothetical protein
MKYRTVIRAASGMERLKTNAFQSEENAFPGSARKLMLLTKVAKIDIPTTHEGSCLPPEVNCSSDLFLKKKLIPRKIFPKVSIKKTVRSTSESFICNYYLY